MSMEAMYGWYYAHLGEADIFFFQPHFGEGMSDKKKSMDSGVETYEPESLP